MRLRLQALSQIQKALHAGGPQHLYQPVHGDVLRVHIVVRDGAEILVIFVVKPEDGSTLTVHVVCSCAWSGGNRKPYSRGERRAVMKTHTPVYRWGAAELATLKCQIGISHHLSVTTGGRTGLRCSRTLGPVGLRSRAWLNSCSQPRTVPFRLLLNYWEAMKQAEYHKGTAESPSELRRCFAYCK
jgi:hypothetical protein